MNKRQILERKIELYKQGLEIVKWWDIRLIIKIKRLIKQCQGELLNAE